MPRRKSRSRSQPDMNHPTVRIAIAAALAVSCSVALIAVADAARPKKSKFIVESKMSGKKVVQNGDPNARGDASLTFKKKKDRVCFDITYEGMATATRGILGEGAKHEVGDDVLTLFTLVRAFAGQGLHPRAVEEGRPGHREGPEGLLRDPRGQEASRRRDPRPAAPRLMSSAPAWRSPRRAYAIEAARRLVGSAVRGDGGVAASRRRASSSSSRR